MGADTDTEEHPGAAAPLRVLVVEGAHRAPSAAALMGAEGGRYAVVRAADVGEAVERLAREGADCVVLGPARVGSLPHRPRECRTA